MTSTLTLTEFLLARIAEDEAVAREFHAHDCDTNEAVAIDFFPCNCGTEKRIKAEGEAKRRIVERATHIESMHDHSGSFTIADLEYAEHILPALASVYADHEDYRAEWRA